MKYIKWKSLIITCLICLLPILLGIALWESLPDEIAIHFNFHNEPDNFASKGMAVFGLPVLMVFLQMFCCIIHDVNAFKYREPKKLESVSKWIIPVACIVLQTVTLGYALGYDIDIRKVAIIIVSGIFLVTGSCLLKLDDVKNYDIDKEKARKINRFIGTETVIMGVLGLVTVFLPPIFSAVWLFLLIPYMIIALIYGVIHARKKKK